MLADRVQSCNCINKPDNPDHNSPIIYCAGNQCCPATVNKPLPMQYHNNMVDLNSTMARKLKIPLSSYLSYYTCRNHIYLGPVVGILSSAVKRNNQVPPARKVGRLFKEMIIYGRNNGVFLYLFGPEAEIDNNHVNGFTVDRAGNWYRGEFPRPDIVYNRIRFRKIEENPRVQKLLHRLSDNPQIFLFNSRFLNKWEVYNVLHKQRYIKGMLPETAPYSLPALEAAMKTYPEVFLKPKNGSIGKGIIKITREAENEYRFCEARQKQQRWQRTGSITELDRCLRKMGVEEKYYLLQRGVELSRFKGRVFDLRTQVQKNGLGLWEPTGIAVRLAGKNRFITHIPNGGQAMEYEEIVNRVFSNEDTRQNIQSQLDLIFSIVPRVLEEELGINLSILSMDIGIDSGGQVWLLEVNSKPSSFDEKHIRYRHLKLLTDYFIFAGRELKECNSRRMVGE